MQSFMPKVSLLQALMSLVATASVLNTVTDGGLKQSINTLQLGPSLSFFQFLVENFAVEQLFQRRFKSIV